MLMSIAAFGCAKRQSTFPPGATIGITSIRGRCGDAAGRDVPPRPFRSITPTGFIPDKSNGFPSRYAGTLQRTFFGFARQYSSLFLYDGNCGACGRTDG